MDGTRRSFLAATAVAGASIGTTGCLGDDESSEPAELPEPPEPPVAGNPDADVTVTVYEDFACDACRQFKFQMLPYLQENYVGPGLIRLEQRDYPLPVDETWSWAVACGARAVYETEGDQAFWEFSAEIYDHFGDYSYDAIETVADDLGFDGGAIREAAQEEEYRDAVEADHAYGDANGVEATPTVFVDDELVEEDLVETIDAAVE
ncbi:thioredoxin domain-containing protein [Natronobacterium gregoryi]|uniref:Disulfide bond formation protein n=2 Tax=Natronobacterium gregoryi TaxID=44930 RepID=L0AFG4_NATGS|nr:thioredoxin domain-containing protein [Natronobacterium gregoryi]AFZ72169.1 protein-disulfide isomerase [Natronobacterium gregoryi SP2]ELY63057.1 disulfide bond formation protein [Natronobacterium gregoryi SP2]PLK20113.1 disulfide bond formation protein [Natronobacterium gregoryi SP2]SFJ32873.1 Tat (twin-arginine translocation) pathway signal sequence [Natronobacterium gregoryi]